MNILLLGCSGSGKTTYLSSLLDCLDNGQKIIRNKKKIEYSIEPSENMTLESYNRIISTICTLQRNSKPEFCKPTDEEDIFEMSLYLNRVEQKKEKLIEFNLMDYRGGILKTISETEQEEIDKLQKGGDDIKKVAKYALVSDVVLVFIDGARFKERYDDIKKARIEIGVRAITTILKRAKDTAEIFDKKIKIVFVITKADSSTIAGRDINKIKGKIPELFNRLYNDFGEESEDFKIIETAVVGRNNIISNVTPIDTGIEITHKLKNTQENLNPYNILSTFSLGILLGLNSMTFTEAELKKKIKSKRLNPLKGIIDTYFKNASEKKEIRKLNKELRKNEQGKENLKMYRGDLEYIIRKHL